MNPIRRIRRIGGALAFACLVLAVAAPAAFARVVPPSGGSGAVTTPTPPSAQVHTVIVGGMAGWQIALIAVGAALVAATIAVLLDRARTARLKPVTEGA
jgi:Na+/proline symporter